MKSIRTDPLNHAAEGDERIRTAEQWLGADPAYEGPKRHLEAVARQVRAWPPHLRFHTSEYLRGRSLRGDGA